VKFASEHDAQLFLVEIERLDLLSQISESQPYFEPDADLMELFIKRRKKLLDRLKDFRRRQMTQSQWRQFRPKMMRGIRRFHKSTTGKRFHRSLGRFNATRDMLKSMFRENFSVSGMADTLKALSSLKTHAFIELEYFHPMTEELEFRIFFEELIPFINRLETSILQGDFDLSEADAEFLARIVEKSSTIYALSERFGVPCDDVRGLWEAQEADLRRDTDDPEEGVSESEVLNRVIFNLQTRAPKPDSSHELPTPQDFQGDDPQAIAAV